MKKIIVREEIRVVAAQAAKNPYFKVDFSAAEEAERLLREIESGECCYAILPTGLTIGPSDKGDYFIPFVPPFGVEIILGGLLPFKKSFEDSCMKRNKTKC